MDGLTEDELQEIERRMFGVGVGAGEVEALVNEVRRLRYRLAEMRHPQTR